MQPNRFIHALEPRRLMAATLNNGVLTVTGTSASDHIEFQIRDTGELQVEVNDSEQRFTYSQITRFVIIAGDGNDFVEFDDETPILKGAEIRGGAGRDVIEGTAVRDSIFGGAGNDRLDGETGSDFVYGESGNDIIEGGTGSDRLFGGSGNDFLEGGTGNDTLSASTGDDDLEGNAGTDVIAGGSGNDDFDNSDSLSELLDKTAADDGANALPFQ